MLEHRDQYFDVVKGLGIALVLLGHLVVYGSPVFTCIFAFHMPLFFVVSGYFFVAENISTYRELAHRVVRCILLPLVYFTAIGFVLQACTGRLPIFQVPMSAKALYVSVVCDQSIGGAASAWFLTCLALVEICYYSAFRAGRFFNRSWILPVLVALSFPMGLAMAKLEVTRECVPLKMLSVPMALFFFGCGALMRRPLKRLSETKERSWLLMGVGVGLLLMSCAVSLYASTKTSRITNLAVPEFAKSVPFLIASITGVAAALLVSKRLPVKALSYVGRNSLVFFLMEFHVEWFLLKAVGCTGPGGPVNPLVTALSFGEIGLILALDLLVLAAVSPLLMGGLRFFQGMLRSRWTR